jgi:intein/homing endonuclease
MTAFAAQDIDTRVFLDPWDVWDKTMPCIQKEKHGIDCPGDPLWDPHPAQLAVAEDRTRHRVLVGGRRLGKSHWGAHELLLEVFITYPLRHDLKARGKRREFFIVGPEYTDGEKEFRVFWNLLNRLGIEMDKPGSYNLPLSGQMHVSLFEGTFQVHVKSAKDPDRLVGEELTGVIMAEAAKQKPIIWTKYIRPMLLDQKGWSIHTSCLTADTLIQTENGIVTLGSMSDLRTPGKYAELGVRVAGFAGDMQLATQFYCNGVQPTKRVIVANGYGIEGTENHRVWTMGADGNPDWTYLRDVQLDDCVAVRAGADVWGDYIADDFVPPTITSRRMEPFDTTLDEDMAYFFGLMIGDGSYPGHLTGGAGIHGGLDPEIWQFCEDFGMNTQIRKAHGIRQETRYFQKQSVQLNAFLKHMGFEKVKTQEKVIPPLVLLMPKKYMVQLVAGLFDSDGAYNAKKHKAWYSSTSPMLIKQIQNVLLNFGIISGITYDGRRLELSRSQTDKFMEIIPLRIKRKVFDRKLASDTSPEIPGQQQRLLSLKSRYEMRGKKTLAHSGQFVQPWINDRAGANKIGMYLDRLEEAYPETAVLDDVLMLRQLCKEGYMWAKVIDIEDGQAETFDLCIPTTHAYSANGIISHNTPEGRNHFYDKFLRGQRASDPDWKSWRVPSWFNTRIFDSPTRTADVTKLLDLSRDNPTISVYDIAKAKGLTINPEILDIAAELTVETFKQEIGADFTEFVGKVFKDFDIEYHCGTLTFQPSWETFACADYGFRNPNVWLLGQIGPGEEINFLEEIYIEGYTPLEFAREIRRRGLNPSSLTYFYPDPARPDTTAVLEEELMVKSHGDTGGEVKTRLDLIRKSLKRGIVDRYFVYKDSKEAERTWRPQMMFDISKCPRTVHDFEVYKYPDKKEDVEDRETSTEKYENPLKLRDHGPEAVGRFMQGRYGLKAMAGAGGESRVSQVRMGGPKPTPLGSIRTRLPQGKPERFMRLTEHEPKGYEYKIDRDDIEELSMKAYYDAED